MKEETFRTRIERVKKAAAGQWMRLLTDAGISLELLNKANRPCPLCGGNDRFTFFRKEEDGGWFCRGCGHGDGISLLQQWRHESFLQTLEYLEHLLGLPPIPSDVTRQKYEKPRENVEKERRQKLEALWDEAIPLGKLSDKDPVRRYLRHRHLDCGRRSCSTELRSHPRMDYWELQSDGVSKREVWPAMLARVTDENGRLVSLHKTYLSQDGQKAPVSAQKKLASSAGENGLIRLFPAGATLGIAEGIETALAASLLHKIPVWSAICANGFKKFTAIPNGVEKLVIFGDNDLSFTGQLAAWELAHRLRRDWPNLAIEVQIPFKDGYDWNDVWCRVQEGSRRPGKKS